jgi:hypothetical protein
MSQVSDLSEKSSVLAFLGQFTDLRQVGAWFSLPIQWLATGQYMVFMDNSVTCDRSVFCFLWNFSDWRQVSKGNNKITELPTILPELSVKTTHWPVAGHWIVRETHAPTCRKSLNSQWKWFSLTIQWLVTGQCMVFFGQSGDLHI